MKVHQLCYLVVQLCCSLQGGASIARTKFKEAWEHRAEKETVIEPQIILLLPISPEQSQE